MNTETHWSVTLTGAIEPQAVAEQAWSQVAALLGRDVAVLRTRLPVTFKPVDEAAARHQCDQLHACGVEAVVLADDDGSRLWVQRDGTTRGPVSKTYARDALARGVWRGAALACLHGQQQWQALRQLVGAAEMPERVLSESVSSSVDDETAADEAPPRRAAAWILAAVCIILLLPLIALVVAVVR